jgi:hypothetical protein
MKTKKELENVALPAVVDRARFQAELDAPRIREKAHGCGFVENSGLWNRCTSDRSNASQVRSGMLQTASYQSVRSSPAGARRYEDAREQAIHVLEIDPTIYRQ